MHIVINSFGAALSKENDLFLIQTPEGRQTIPPDKVRSISIHKAARITSDAVILAIRHDIDILFVNEQGAPEGRVWSVQYGSISTIRRAQVEFLYGSRATAWVQQLLRQKIDGQIALLLALQPDREADLRRHNLLRAAINGMEDHKQKILKASGAALSDIAPSLRGWEGAANKKYFAALSALLPAPYQFEGRSRQPATDPFNALLNYAYGMLYGKVEGALIKAGLDPYLGVFHRDDYNRPALVYDFIEPYRIWMDYVVIQLCRYEAFPDDGFETNPDTGGIVLNAFVRRILIQSVNDYMSEIVGQGTKARSRQALLEQDAHALAKTFTSQSAEP